MLSCWAGSPTPPSDSGGCDLDVGRDRGRRARLHQSHRLACAVHRGAQHTGNTAGTIGSAASGRSDAADQGRDALVHWLPGWSPGLMQHKGFRRVCGTSPSSSGPSAAQGSAEGQQPYLVVTSDHPALVRLLLSSDRRDDAIAAAGRLEAAAADDPDFLRDLRVRVRGDSKAHPQRLWPPGQSCGDVREGPRAFCSIAAASGTWRTASTLQFAG